MQVSDRFHLWQGLSRRVQDVAAAHRACLPAALPPAEEADPAQNEETTDDAAAETPAGRHARRLFEAVHALTNTGHSYSAVAWELGLRWDEGEHNATVLHEELRNNGSLGHYQRVKMAVAPLRRGFPLDQPREHPPSPRETARWITSDPDRRNLHITDRLHRLLDHCPKLRHNHDLVRRFAAMLDNRDATPLAAWLDELAHSGLAPLAGVAGALREDQQAVAYGIATPYNSGVNEGRIADVKLQKRLMAGRAGVPLLRHRVVLIAHLRRRYADRPPPAPR